MHITAWAYMIICYLFDVIIHLAEFLSTHIINLWIQLCICTLKTFTKAIMWEILMTLRKAKSMGLKFVSICIFAQAKTTTWNWTRFSQLHCLDCNLRNVSSSYAICKLCFKLELSWAKPYLLKRGFIVIFCLQAAFLAELSS